jgi:hypothetical protein
MNDPLIEKCTGNFECNGDGSVVGKKYLERLLNLNTAMKM